MRRGWEGVRGAASNLQQKQTPCLLGIKKVNRENPKLEGEGRRRKEGLV